MERNISKAKIKSMNNNETMKTSYRANILRSVSLDPENVRSIRPDILRLEVTNVCNNRCLFCGNRKMSRPVGFIKESIVRKALLQAREMGIQKVSFYTIGEPLLHPDLATFVKMAKEQKFAYAFLNTNGGGGGGGLRKPAENCGLGNLQQGVFVQCHQ
jgi:uncharacterized radical SAM superfamily Fe-S cluster-containing enzyme